MGRGLVVYICHALYANIYIYLVHYLLWLFLSALGMDLPRSECLHAYGTRFLLLTLGWVTILYSPQINHP